MKVTRVDFDDEGAPSEVHVSMPLSEVAAILAVFGKMNWYAHQRLRIAGADPSIYDALSGVVDRWWENGIHDFGLGRIGLTTLNDRPEGVS